MNDDTILLQPVKASVAAPASISASAPAAQGTCHAASRGMSLIEILVVLAIIGMVMGGIAVVAGGAFSDAQTDTAKNEVVELENHVEMYKLKKKGQCPKDLQDLVSAGVTKRVKADPWGTNYQIKCPGEHGAVDIMSAGPDKQFGTPDDVQNWGGGEVEGN